MLQFKSHTYSGYLFICLNALSFRLLGTTNNEFIINKSESDIFINILSHIVFCFCVELFHLHLPLDRCNNKIGVMTVVYVRCGKVRVDINIHIINSLSSSSSNYNLFIQLNSMFYGLNLRMGTKLLTEYM